jgi:hypothetical protein
VAEWTGPAREDPHGGEAIHLLLAGIPRITRPRTPTSGFSVVNPGGNWIRVSPLGGWIGANWIGPR